MHVVRQLRQKVKWDYYRRKLTDSCMREGEKLVNEGLDPIQVGEDGRSGTLTIRKFVVTAHDLPINYEQINNAELSFLNARNLVSCTCAPYQKSSVCKHTVAFMLLWEKQVGPFEMDEPDEVYYQKLEEQRKARGRSALAPLFADLKEQDDTFYQPWLALNAFDAKKEEIAAAETLLRETNGTLKYTVSPSSYDSGLTTEMQFGTIKTTMSFGRGTYCHFKHRCPCGAYHITVERRYVTYEIIPDTMCRHELVLLHKTWEMVLRDDPGDMTDDNGKKLMNLSFASPAGQRSVQVQEGRLKLRPRIEILSLGQMRLTFQLELPNGKQYSIKNVNKLEDAVDSRGTLALSQAISVSFREEKLDEESKRSMKYIHLMRMSVQRINNMINGSHSYYYAQSHPANYGYASYLPVEYENLDAFYDLFNGCGIPVAGTDYEMSVGGLNSGVTLTVRYLKDNGSINGAEVEGRLPALTEGLIYRYLVDQHAVRRVDNKDLDSIRKFLNIQTGGWFKAEIGHKMIDRFRNEVLPDLTALDYVSIQYVDE